MQNLDDIPAEDGSMHPVEIGLAKTMRSAARDLAAGLGDAADPQRTLASLTGLLAHVQLSNPRLELAGCMAFLLRNIEGALQPDGPIDRDVWRLLLRQMTRAVADVVMPFVAPMATMALAHRYRLHPLATAANVQRELPADASGLLAAAVRHWGVRMHRATAGAALESELDLDYRSDLDRALTEATIYALGHLASGLEGLIRFTAHPATDRQNTTCPYEVRWSTPTDGTLDDRLEAAGAVYNVYKRLLLEDRAYLVGQLRLLRDEAALAVGDFWDRVVVPLMQSEAAERTAVVVTTPAS